MLKSSFLTIISSGVIITTSESALFDLMRSADHPNFKAISAAVKETNLLDDEFKDNVGC